MANPKAVPHGAIILSAESREEYLVTIAEYEHLGYEFIPCDDLKRLHWGSLGVANPSMPIVWVRMPILQVVGEADADAEVGSIDEYGHFVTCGEMHFGDRIEEATTDVFDYHKAFNDHKSRGHHLIEASDPLTYRLAFVCVTCARLVRVDWDQCIDLGAALEGGIKESQ